MKLRLARFEKGQRRHARGLVVVHLDGLVFEGPQVRSRVDPATGTSLSAEFGPDWLLEREVVSFRLVLGQRRFVIRPTGSARRTKRDRSTGCWNWTPINAVSAGRTELVIEAARRYVEAATR